MNVLYKKAVFSFPRPENIALFAREIGVSRNAVYFWLNGVKVPSEANRKKIAEYFAIS